MPSRREATHTTAQRPRSQPQAESCGELLPPPPGIVASMALANLMMFPGHCLPPFDAMLWYAAREDTEFHVGWDCANPRTPWWVDRIRFDCSADPTDNSRLLKAIRCSGVSQLRSLVLQARGCQTKVNLDDTLTEWTTLRRLEIHNEGVHCITVSGWECLTGLVQLTSLNLTCCENLTDAGLQHLTALCSCRR